MSPQCPSSFEFKRPRGGGVALHGTLDDAVVRIYVGVPLRLAVAFPEPVRYVAFILIKA